MGVGIVELIPNRNAQPKALEFSRFFRREGFSVLLGTEHNAPDMIPLTPRCRGGAPLGEELADIGWRGACVVAAHQERKFVCRMLKTNRLRKTNPSQM
jgi:hypothetical protein